MMHSILRFRQVLFGRGEAALKSRRGAAMLVNMVIVGMMMGLMATSFSQLASGQFSNMAAYRTALQAYQVAEAKANEIGVTSYSSLASAARAVVTGATGWQREVIVGAEVDLGGGNRQRPVTINVYSGSETAPRASIVKYPTSAGTAAGVPSGVIAVWRGSAATIPAGWVLCDGQNGTPDLRSRFVWGATDYSYKNWSTGWNVINGHPTVGQTGGEEQTVLTRDQMPWHNHDGVTDTQGWHGHGAYTNTMGGTHTHTYSVASQGGGEGSGLATVYNFGGVNIKSFNTSAGNDAHSHTVTVNGDGNHSHNVVGTYAGKGERIWNMPPFMALCYMMKL